VGFSGFGQGMIIFWLAVPSGNVGVVLAATRSHSHRCPIGCQYGFVLPRRCANTLYAARRLVRTQKHKRKTYGSIAGSEEPSRGGNS
jgi:hypothetical protein